MPRFTATLKPDTDTIAALNDNVAAFLDDAAVDARATHHVALVLDEILTNLASHADASDMEASVVIEIEPDRVRGEIVDRGKPFDPRHAPEPDLTVPIEQREVGGLGLHLVRQLTSALDYRTDGGQNWTMFCVPRGRPAT
jgi:anti-sigma regulatory factor (Ser/Thr protein kinase)